MHPSERSLGSLGARRRPSSSPQAAPKLDFLPSFQPPGTPSPSSTPAYTLPSELGPIPEDDAEHQPETDSEAPWPSYAQALATWGQQHGPPQDGADVPLSDDDELELRLYTAVLLYYRTLLYGAYVCER